MWKVYKVFFLMVFQGFFLVAGLQAQEEKENVFLHPKKFYKKFLPNLKIKPKKLDTVYMHSYPNYLSVAAHILVPKIYYNLNPVGLKSEGKNASSRFRTDINTILAFSGSYRFVTVGFAISLEPGTKDKGGYAHTRYRTATIKYNNPKYNLQFKYVKLRGLTDINTANNLDSTKKFVARPDITMKEFHFEGVYNFSWRKYSYRAPIDFTQRQVKSRLGFLVKAGIYNNQMYSDSNLLSARQRPHFEEFTDINKMIGYSLKVSPGIGGNLVFMRRLYLSATLFTPYNLYISKLYRNDDDLSRKETSIQLVLDGMVSLGYQSERFFASLRYQIESKGTNLKYTSSFMVYSYIGLDIGYRFTTPKFVKKFYKKTMPPGM